MFGEVREEFLVQHLAGHFELEKGLNAKHLPRLSQRASAVPAALGLHDCEEAWATSETCRCKFGTQSSGG